MANSNRNHIDFGCLCAEVPKSTTTAADIYPIRQKSATNNFTGLLMGLSLSG